MKKRLQERAMFQNANPKILHQKLEDATLLVSLGILELESPLTGRLGGKEAWRPTHFS